MSKHPIPSERRVRRESSPEPNLFTDEPSLPIRVCLQSEEAALQRVRDVVRARARGEETAVQTVVSFTSMQALLEVLSPRRAQLLDSVKAQGAYESIEALARALGRPRSAVSRDVRRLAGVGLLQLSNQPLSGHGRRCAVRVPPRRERFELDL